MKKLSLITFALLTLSTQAEIISTATYQDRIQSGDTFQINRVGEFQGSLEDEIRSSARYRCREAGADFVEIVSFGISSAEVCEKRWAVSNIGHFRQKIVECDFQTSQGRPAARTLRTFEGFRSNAEARCIFSN